MQNQADEGSRSAGTEVGLPIAQGGAAHRWAGGSGTPLTSARPVGSEPSTLKMRESRARRGPTGQIYSQRRHRRFHFSTRMMGGRSTRSVGVLRAARSWDPLLDTYGAGSSDPALARRTYQLERKSGFLAVS